MFKSTKRNMFSNIDKLLDDANRLLTDYRTGVYASVTLDPQGISKLWEYLKKIDLPMQHIQNAHITVIHSRTRPTTLPKIKEIFGEVKPKKFSIFGRGTPKEPYVLVLEVTSPALEKAHMEFKKQGLKPTYNEYSPHITLVLDLNRIFPGIKHMSKKQKQNITNIFDMMIPELPKNIKIQKLKIEPLKF